MAGSRKPGDPMCERSDGIVKRAGGQHSIELAVLFSQLRVVILPAQHDLKLPRPAHETCQVLDAARLVDRAERVLRLTEENRLAYEAGAETLRLWEEIWPEPAMKLVGPLATRSPGLRLALALEIERRRSADEVLQGASSTLLPLWLSMARLAFP
jgi:hypothetical protein